MSHYCVVLTSASVTEKYFHSSIVAIGQTILCWLHCWCLFKSSKQEIFEILPIQPYELYMYKCIWSCFQGVKSFLRNFVLSKLMSHEWYPELSECLGWIYSNEKKLWLFVWVGMWTRLTWDMQEIKNLDLQRTILFKFLKSVLKCWRYQQINMAISSRNSATTSCWLVTR